jgi:hypothetical protein
MTDLNFVYSYELMKQQIGELESVHRGLVQVEIIAQTPYQRDIFAIGIGHGPSCAVLSAAHHAREWMTSQLMMKMLQTYAKAYVSDDMVGGYSVRELLNQATIWFVPMVDVDGVELQQHGVTAFPESVRASLIQMNLGSEDFSAWKANAQGLDLNRQYDGAWDGISVDAVTHPASKNYKGTRPYEATEVKALMAFLAKVNPPAEIAYHSAGEVIFWGLELDLDDPRHLAGKELAALTGYELLPPLDAKHGGGLTDWWTHNLGKIGFTIEIGSPSTGEGPVSQAEFPKVWEANKAVGLWMADYVLQHSLLSSGKTQA